LFFLFQATYSYAQIIASYTLKADSVCSSEDGLMVISGREIPQLSGSNREKISLLNVLHNKKQSIVFQIDKKDTQGRYILNNNTSGISDTSKIMGDQDELVFRKKDLGEHLSPSSELLKQHSLIEIEVIYGQGRHGGAAHKKVSGWIYIALNDISPDFQKQNKPFVYDSEQDSVISSVYKIAFSKEKPFLLDEFHWRLPEQSPKLAQPTEWSSDMTDTMKIRHIGNFLGFPFKRTDDDYYSQLIDIKEGPLRIIRRTENKVKIFWKLKSPALYIDYVMMPDGFVMDSMIDIPFNISFFFSDLVTITTMDWDHAPDLPGLTIKSEASNLKLPVNGRLSDDKDTFNQIAATEFSLMSQLGQFDVKLDIPDDFPIYSQLYLRDALHEIDLPENYPGQFGNVGFKTTGWENIGSKLHHLKFTVCVDKI